MKKNSGHNFSSLPSQPNP